MASIFTSSTYTSSFQSPDHHHDCKSKTISTTGSTVKSFNNQLGRLTVLTDRRSSINLQHSRLQAVKERNGSSSISSSVDHIADRRDREVVMELQKGIAEFYDDSSSVWEDIWGEHMHHGFYDPNASPSLADHRSAQIRMIEEALAFASVPDDSVRRPKKIIDVGCGIGGSSRFLARKYDAACTGITLSPFQAQRANELAASQGLAEKVSFQVADALDQPFPDGQFDLVWSMESGEHMPDKQKFVSELVRVAAPGANIIIVTWCHRDLLPPETSLKPDELNLLKKICDSFYLPAWCSGADYVKIAESLSLQDIRRADWSENVAPFWPAVIRSALTFKGFTSLLGAGWKTIKGALVMPLMIKGYKRNLIKFSIITCRKPELSETEQ